jgi:hypothetical protein
MEGFFSDPGSSASARRCSARSAAGVCTSSILRFLTIATAASARSLMMDSTSRPTYPTSVNFVASTLTNGAFTSSASLRAISVLPTPVGPTIRIFFGATSFAISGERFLLRIRFRSAMATDFFAFSWPTMYRSRYSTIRRGVSSISSIALFILLLPPQSQCCLYKCRSPKRSQ